MSKRPSLERQLNDAKARLEAYGKGKQEIIKKDPIWRGLRAKVRAATHRLNSLAAVEKQDAEHAAAKASAE
jgi:hypothetical protein